MVFFFKWSISGLFCISQKSTKWPMNVPLVRISGVGSDCSKNCVTTSAYCYFKCGPITASFCLFSSFSHYNSNLNWKKNGARCCAWDSNPGHRMVGADSSIEQCHYCFHLGFYLDYPYSCFQLSKFLFSAMSGCCGQKSWHLKCFQLGLSEFLIATI